MSNATRCTPERTAKIASYIKEGSSFNGACKAALISPSCGKDWLTQGEIEFNSDIQTPYSDFYVAIKEAEADLENTLTKRWTKSLLNDENGWKGIENYLAKRFKDDWGKTSLEISATVTDLRKSPEFNAIVALIMDYVPPEKMEALARDLSQLNVSS